MNAIERLLLDHADQMILLVEPATLRIVYANRVAEQMLGYRMDELLEKTILDVECALQDVFYWEEVRNGQLANVESQEGLYLCADGEMRSANKTVKVVEQDGNAWLMIQAREPQGDMNVADDLANTTSQLRATLESTGNGILVIDWQGRVASMNRLFSAMWHLPETVLLSQDDQAILAHVSSSLVEAERFEQRLREIMESQETEDLLHLKDGRVFQCKSLPLYLDERINGRVFGFNDITERIHIEQDLIAARERAEAANQAKASFLAMMSHEIRTPINGVMGMGSLLADTQPTAEQKRYLDVVRSSSESLLSIINDILDFSKIEAHKMVLESIDFNLLALLEDLADLNGLRADENGLEFACCLDEDVPVLLHGDPGRLNQILLNLIGNALKFTPAGSITLQVRRLPERQDPPMIQFVVSDTGIGIARENLDRIFAPFEQADSTTTRRFGGTGLGLAITRQLVGLMGGEIGVDSEEGKGTCFTLNLPLALASGKMAPVTLLSLPVSLAGLKGERLLVADDNAVARQGLAARLRALGFVVEEAATAEAAQAMLASSSPQNAPYRALFLDRDLPGVEGRSLSTAFAASGLVQIACVPSGFRGSADEFTVAGFRDFLHKPVRTSVLLDCLGRLFGPVAAGNVLAADDVPRPVVGEKKIAHLLVVEDNAVNMLVIKGILAKLGYAQVDKARDGLEAIDAVGRASYDLIFMDCQMPKLDGYAATQRLREQGLATPIIAMTANALAGDREKCLEAGMDDYLTKPIVTEKLAACLAHWLG